MVQDRCCFRRVFLAPVLAACLYLSGGAATAQDEIELQERVAMGFSFQLEYTEQRHGLRIPHRFRQTVHFRDRCQITVAHDVIEPLVRIGGGRPPELRLAQLEARQSVNLSEVVIQSVLVSRNDGALVFERTGRDRLITVAFTEATRDILADYFDGFNSSMIFGPAAERNYRLSGMDGDRPARVTGWIRTPARGSLLHDFRLDEPAPEAVLAFRRLVRLCAP